MTGGVSLLPLAPPPARGGRLHSFGAAPGWGRREPLFPWPRSLVLFRSPAGRVLGRLDVRCIDAPRSLRASSAFRSFRPAGAIHRFLVLVNGYRMGCRGRSGPRSMAARSDSAGQAPQGRRRCAFRLARVRIIPRARGAREPRLPRRARPGPSPQARGAYFLTCTIAAITDTLRAAGVGAAPGTDSANRSDGAGSGRPSTSPQLRSMWLTSGVCRAARTAQSRPSRPEFGRESVRVANKYRGATDAELLTWGYARCPEQDSNLQPTD